MPQLYYGLYLHYLPTARLLSHVLCQLGGPPGRSRWLWTLMNFTSNFDALISMVLRFKLRLDVIFMQARARVVHGVNPRLFCTLTKCFRERNIRLICDQSSQMIRIKDTDSLQEQRIAQQMFALTRPCSGSWLAAPRSRDRAAASHWSAVLLLLLSALFRMFARVNKDKTGVARCWENVITVKENCIKPWTRVSQTLRWFEEG